jgi:hypothetical protein
MDFRGLTDDQIELHLDRLADAIEGLREPGGQAVACPPMWDAVECLDGCQFYQFLSRERTSTVDRDTLVRSFTLLSRCPEWVADDDAETTVTITGERPVLALSVAYALHSALSHRGVACLVFGGSSRQGFLEVRGAREAAEVYFFADAADLMPFWRHLFEFEDVAECDFFALCGDAFPQLVMHPDLSFGKFESAYRDLRTRVVTILGGICDHFVEACRRCHGLPREIQAEMGGHHVELSPESPNTRGSERLMRLRRRDYEGNTFTCEWHAKVEPGRNRIHFAARVFADAATCLAEVDRLRLAPLRATVSVSSLDGRARWIWRVAVGGRRQPGVPAAGVGRGRVCGLPQPGRWRHRGRRCAGSRLRPG